MHTGSSSHFGSSPSLACYTSISLTLSCWGYCVGCDLKLTEIR